MQISPQEVDRVLKETARKADHDAVEAPVRSVEELAGRHGVQMDEVRTYTEMAMTAEEDPAREKRLRELQRRIAQGSYRVDADQLVDMAERRAIADRSAEL